VNPPTDFIGRDEEIEKIRQFLTDTPDPVKVTLLYGVPLVGKSALAKRLCMEFSGLYPDFHFTINMKGTVKHYIDVTTPQFLNCTFSQQICRFQKLC
jgi:AAA+ ATPase superfamily predicted ATPase